MAPGAAAERRLGECPYSIGRRKGTANTLAALKPIRAARPDSVPIHIVALHRHLRRRPLPDAA